MPRHHVRKITRESYSKEQLLTAISAVKSGRSTKFAKSTVRLRMKAGITSTAQLDRKATFTPDQEHKLASTF